MKLQELFEGSWPSGKVDDEATKAKKAKRREAYLKREVEKMELKRGFQDRVDAMKRDAAEADPPVPIRQQSALGSTVVGTGKGHGKLR